MLEYSQALSVVALTKSDVKSDGMTNELGTSVSGSTCRGLLPLINVRRLATTRGSPYLAIHY
jgi:hypothetical protein